MVVRAMSRRDRADGVAAVGWLLLVLVLGTVVVVFKWLG